MSQSVEGGQAAGDGDRGGNNFGRHNFVSIRPRAEAIEEESLMEEDECFDCIDNAMYNSVTSGATNWAVEVLAGEHKDESLRDPLIQRLFRLFLIFTDELDTPTRDHSQSQTYEDALIRKQKLNVHEVRFLAGLIGREIGLTDMPSTSAEVDSEMTVPWPCAQCSCELRQRIGDRPQMYTFKELIWTLGRLFPDRSICAAAVDSIFHRIVNQVIKKGFVYIFRRNLLRKHACDLAMCMVSPGKLHFWPIGDDKTGPVEKSRRKEYLLNKTSIVQAHPVEHKGKHIWSVRLANNRTLVFGAAESVERYRWVAAVQLAIVRCDDVENVYKPVLAQLSQRHRDATRAASQQRTTSQKKHRTSSPVVGASSEEQQNEFDRLKLESQLAELYSQLKSEKQATRDEEIVRTLATRMFEEERERREALEQQNKANMESLRLEKQLRAAREAELEDLREQLEQMRTNEQQRRNREDARRVTDEQRVLALQQLKRDQEALLQYQRELRQTVLATQQAQRDSLKDTSRTLTELLFRTRERVSLGTVDGIENPLQPEKRSPEERRKLSKSRLQKQPVIMEEEEIGETEITEVESFPPPPSPCEINGTVVTNANGEIVSAAGSRSSYPQSSLSLSSTTKMSFSPNSTTSDSRFYSHSSGSTSSDR